MGNKFDQKALEDKAYDDAKKDNYDPPHSTNVLKDIISAVTPAYDKEVEANAEYRKLYDEAKDAIEKHK